MPVIDDLQFTAKSLLAKLQRINEIAKQVEETPTNKKNVALFKAMTTKIDGMMSQYEETIQKIAAYNAKQNPRIQEDLEARVTEFDELFYNAKAVLEVTLPPDDNLNQSIVNVGIPQTSSVGHISLPRMKLAEFDGNIRNWPNFSELYLATIHNNTQLSDIQRYMYLRSLLQGEALALIASLPITAANYAVAWAALQSRYNDTNLLTNSYLESLFNTGTVTREATSLRAFATSLAEYTGALENLGLNVAGWAVPVLFLLVKRLCPPLRERWEKFVVENPIPSIQQFITFVGDEARILEAAHSGGAAKRLNVPRNWVASTPVKGPYKGPTTLIINAPSSSNACSMCTGAHFIAECAQFRKKSVSDRLRCAKDKRLCLNCLNSGHFLNNCTKRSTCKHCAKTHHSLLHFGNKPTVDVGEKGEQPAPSQTADEESLQNPSTELTVGTLQTNTVKGTAVILLATAQACIQDSNGKYQKVKILIDSASQGTFITSACARRLNLQIQPASVPVFGMAQTKLGVARGTVTCNFERARNMQLRVEALVVERITNCPSMPLPLVEWAHLENLTLADKNYFCPQAVDILLGAEWFGSVVLGNPVIGPQGSPSAVETIWGYCLVGRVPCDATGVETFCVGTQEQLDITIRKFWEVEESPASPIESKDDRECKALYRASVSRTPSGRYITALPFRKSAPQLGASREFALRRFQLLERRLAKNVELRSRYNEFMSDYENQGHMIRVNYPIASQDSGYYIPHHCICSPDPRGSKFRVVFDASMQTSTGTSLNDTLYSGPKLQAILIDLLVTFRLHNVVLVADIRQMYRNIVISQKHQDFQRIFWRFNPEAPLHEYCLTTVTYGISASPYLTIRTLRQLVADEGESLPAASQAMLLDTNMDDIVTSVPSVSEALVLQKELIDLMHRGGFELRKWRSNRQELLTNLNPEHYAMPSEAFSFEESADYSAKILGLVWDPLSDCLSYRTSLKDNSVTKRTILSDIARLFDPLGLVCPVVFYGKWLIQHLWQLGLNWDEPVPEEICSKWLEIRRELPELAKIALPRCVSVDTALRVHLHGFADSSEKGYAGVFYLSAEQMNGTSTLSLILAKSKVAPLKKVTIPRLELCAVVLTARLVSHVKEILKNRCQMESTTVWTDSKVALSWVQSSPHRWHTYVANRVSQAQSCVSPQHYRHIASELNPADCASRGLTPRELIQHPLWLSGPPWLSAYPHTAAAAVEHDSQAIQPILNQEARLVTLHTAIDATESFVTRLFERVSSLTFLKRIVAWIMRFAHNCNKQRNQIKVTGTLSVAELSLALQLCIKLVQNEEFAADIQRLKTEQQATAQLRKLNPFIDKIGLLRVGGRLKHAQLSEERKHPILLPKSHALTLLIIDHYHKMYAHPGSQNLLSIIQSQFWIIAARDVIRHRLSKCVTCFRTQPRPIQPMMADLPAARLRTVKAFKVTGVDYGGPFDISLERTRNAKVHKAYICLFVCFSTKAVHLELASELSTEAFLAALRRFIARRGQVSDIYSDCGTNFVGASRKLTEWTQLVADSNHNDYMRRQLAERNINWHFNPPASPHFGGLWEAGIKSTKQLLRKVIGSQLLTYEEFYTVLVQVEATLNSRPLTPCSSDPNDLQTLTPGHFLLLEPPTALLEPDVTADQVTPMQRWKLLQHISASFWKRWSAEYLSTLQQRGRWTRSGPNIPPDSLVLIRDDNLPPLHWRRGRIVKVFPGKDGVVRVAEVKTANGCVTRPVVKLCPLPVI